MRGHLLFVGLHLISPYFSHETGVTSTTLNMRPGIHHVKFVVDGDMRVSDNLPTAVDLTNQLVNYIEASADDVSKGHGESDRAFAADVPLGVQAPQVLPDSVTIEQASDTSTVQAKEKYEGEEENPLQDFRNIIPQSLVDLDKGEESVDRYQQSSGIFRETYPPPSLPLFLAKSVLNGTMPLKDDPSVLSYPNHTVLNHLATRSIKNGVLATNVTTRYKRKYVTTILYKPIGDVPK